MGPRAPSAILPFLVVGTVLLLGVVVSPRSLFAQASISTESDVVFAVHEGYSLKMDLAYPKELTGPYPVLIYISGSGWGHWRGSPYDQHQYDGAIREAAGGGYVAATVEYRPTSIKVNGDSRYRYPDQLIDVRSAVRWLRAHAARYHIDPLRFGAIGWSSGGHLSLMLALADGGPNLPGEDDNLSSSSGVQAAVSIAGTTEMSRMFQEATYPGMQEVIADLMGGTPVELPDAYRAASPLYYATKSTPPVLMIQGENDTEVPPDQATMLYEKLQKLGTHPRLVMLASTGHWNDYGNPAIFSFLDSVLKGDH